MKKKVENSDADECFSRMFDTFCLTSAKNRKRGDCAGEISNGLDTTSNLRDLLSSGLPL